MAGRHAFWVIVTGATPTAFRSRYREDLLPTLAQLRRTSPDAVLQWFDRGKLWESPDAAREALARDRRESRGRGRDWRPGGNHRDPRARYQLTRDQKRARFRKRRGWKRADAPSTPSGGDERTLNRPPGKRPRPHWRPDRPDGRNEGRPQTGRFNRGGQAGDDRRQDQRRPDWRSRSQSRDNRRRRPDTRKKKP